MAQTDGSSQMALRGNLKLTLPHLFAHAKAA